MNKLSYHIQSVNRWPLFLSFEEDTRLRDDRWNEYYGNESRIIMWDNTNVPMFQPSLANSQRITYSKYYGGNVAKGAVFLQPSGWMGGNELWVGSVSDTEYMENSGVFERQQTYLNEIDVAHSDKEWTIIVDKGYRIGTSVSWNENQKITILQPTFAIAEQKFTDKESVRSAAIANDRSANERAVNRMKISDYINRGLLPNECPKRISDVWIAWGFQCNFMYKPVL
jgi:DDE superfamily endonuclease